MPPFLKQLSAVTLQGGQQSSTSRGCNLEHDFFKPCWESFGNYPGQICNSMHPPPPELFAAGQRVHGSCSLSKTEHSLCLAMVGKDGLGQLSSRTHVPQGSDWFAKLIIKIYPLSSVKTSLYCRHGETPMTRAQGQVLG